MEGYVVTDEGKVGNGGRKTIAIVTAIVSALTTSGYSLYQAHQQATETKAGAQIHTARLYDTLGKAVEANRERCTAIAIELAEIRGAMQHLERADDADDPDVLGPPRVFVPVGSEQLSLPLQIEYPDDVAIQQHIEGQAEAEPMNNE